MRLFKQLLGWAFTLVGGAFSIMALADLVSPENTRTKPDVLAGLLFMFGGLTLGGVKLLLSARVKPEPPALPEGTHEQAALLLAREAGGTIGAAQLAASSGMHFSDARKTLDALVKQGACHVVVGDSGVELYRFPDLALTAEAARKTKDLLE